MKILWIVNIVMPELAAHLHIEDSSSGTWLLDIAGILSNNNDVELGIACVYGDEYREIKVNKTTYFLLPGNGKNMLFYTKKYEKIWKQVKESFNPEIVHLHGTEYSHGLSFLRVYPDIKAVVSIQGVLSRIKDVSFGGLSWGQVFRYRTLRENLHMNGMLEMHYMHKKNAKHEQEILNRVGYANCVNFWDESMVRSINPKLKCFRIGYNLREEFYSAPKWDIEKIERRNIFTNPGATPLKGLDMLLKAIAIVKREYPDVKVTVPGFTPDINGSIVINSGYSKYIAGLIKMLDLKNNIVFLGKQSGTQMMENMLKANAVVIPSAIEGTSLILREAMFLGVPCIASFRGGMADYIADKQDGFLYDYQEYPYLAYRLIELFKNDDLCAMFSKNAIEKTEKAHDRKNNPDDYLNMYKYITED
jgi:L-malate glycosyltransferase